MLPKSGLAGPEAVEGCWMCCEEEGSSHSARHRKSEMLCGGQTGSGSCARDRRELASPAKGSQCFMELSMGSLQRRKHESF